MMKLCIDTYTDNQVIALTLDKVNLHSRMPNMFSTLTWKDGSICKTLKVT